MDDKEKEPQPLDLSVDGGDNNENSSDEVSVKTISAEHLSEAILTKNKTELERIFSEVPDIDIAEAAMKDGDNILSRKQLVSSMFKTRGDLKKEISASKKSPVSGSSFSFPSSDGGINIVPSQTGLIPPRLFE